MDDNGSQRKSGVLTGEDIKMYGLIKPDDGQAILDRQYKANSFDLSLGYKHYVSSNTGRWKAYCLNLCEEELKEGPIPFEYTPSLRIPAFGSAIVELREPVDTLSVLAKKGLQITARFDLKLKAVYKGLISQQATQVEPCYYGKLYCFLHNFSSQEAVFHANETMATIEFSYAGKLTSPEKKKELLETTINDTKEKYSGRYSFKIQDLLDKVAADETGEKNAGKAGEEAPGGTRSEDDNNIAELCKGLEDKGCGICDVRWFHELDRLPRDCGLTPIYQKLGEQFSSEVERCLERSETVDRISDRVNAKLEGQQTTLKMFLGVGAVALSFFGINYFIEVKEEIHYLTEELLCLKEQQQYGQLSDVALEAMKEHTEALYSTRSCIFWAGVIAIVMAVIICLVIAYFARNKKRKSSEEWEDKEKQLLAERSYNETSMRLQLQTEQAITDAKQSRERAEATWKNAKIAWNEAERAWREAEKSIKEAKEHQKEAEKAKENLGDK